MSIPALALQKRHCRRGACIDDLNFEDLYVETTASAAQAEASALAAYDDIDIVSRPTATLSNVD